VHTCDRLAVAPRMVAPEHQGGWARRLRSGSAALAAAAALAMPSGQARAVEQLARGDEAASIARDTGAAVSSSRKVTPAFLGFRRRVKNEPIHSRGPRSGDEIDMDKIMSAKEARRFTDRSFIFSEGLTSKSELAEELEELDMLKEEKKGQLLAQTAISVGGSVGLVVGAVKLLTGVERWMKQMELRDIEEEERLTGQYIGVDASDVEYVIDPKTGKNLTIAGNKKKNATSTDAVAEEDKSPGPWILRVLGLDSATASDDDDFWSPAAAAKSKPKSDGKGKGKGGGGPQAGGGGSGGGGGGDGTGDGNDDDDGGDDDDSSGVDALDDLLG